VPFLFIALSAQTAQGTEYGYTRCPISRKMYGLLAAMNNERLPKCGGNRREQRVGAHLEDAGDAGRIYQLVLQSEQQACLPRDPNLNV